MGVTGFDVGHEAIGACRGVEFLVNPATQKQLPTTTTTH